MARFLGPRRTPLRGDRPCHVFKGRLDHSNGKWGALYGQADIVFLVGFDCLETCRSRE